MSEVPYIAWQRRQEGDDPGYWVGKALDELVEYAKGEGARDSELHERLEEALDRAEPEESHE